MVWLSHTYFADTQASESFMDGEKEDSDQAQNDGKRNKSTVCMSFLKINKPRQSHKSKQLFLFMLNI